MPAVSTDLDWIQSRLHDSGALWPRTELLGWWNDGYRELLARSRAVRRLRPLDLPGRHTYAMTHDWEDRHSSGGTIRNCSRTSTGEFYQPTGLWEVGAVVGITPAASLTGYTHEWERGQISGAVDNHFRFAFPRNHDRVVRLEWQDRGLVPVSVRELDDTDTAWMAQIGEPRWWTTGVGRVKTVELHEVTSTDVQSYDLRNPEVGIARSFNASIAAPGAQTITDTFVGTTGVYGLASLFFAGTDIVHTTTSLVAGTPIVSTSQRAYEVNVAPDRQANAYAYTSSGDAEALSSGGSVFAPATAYTQTWEAASGLLTLPTFNFGINLTMLDALYRNVVVHPWEIGRPSDAATPGKRGMFAWERLDPTRNFSALLPAARAVPALSGLGLRCTAQSLTLGFYFGTQPWEADMLDHATLRTGLRRGAYTWEQKYGAQEMILGVGAIRSLSSPDRQYLGVYADAGQTSLCGRITDWRSSESVVMAVEVVVPDLALGEADTPCLIPPPMQKYLRYYVLARAWGHAGEGRQPALADHCTQRFLRGVTFFRTLTDLAMNDRVFARDQVASDDRYTPPRVRFPSNYPAVAW